MKKSSKLILSLVVTVVLLAILISQIELSEVIRVISAIPPEYVILGFFLYLSFNLFRALRFRHLLDYKIGLGDLFPIVLVHTLSLNTLPARAGELAYPYMTKKRGIKTGESIASLLMARFFDMMSLSVIFLLSVFFIGDVPPVILGLLYGISIIMFLLIMALAFIFYYGKNCIKVFRRVSGRLKLRRFSFFRWILKKVREVVNGFSVIRIRRKLLGTALFSAAIWLTASVFYWVLLRGIGVDLSIFAIIISITFVLFSSFLPVQGIAGFGTIEGAWTLAFMAFGIPKEVAIASGFSLHIIRLLYSAISGSLAYSVLKYRGRI